MDTENKPWIYGPFLEVSFILETKRDRVKFLEKWFKTLSRLPQFCSIEGDIHEYIEKFSYYCSEYDKAPGKCNHDKSIAIFLLINVAGERRSVLSIHELSNNITHFNFSFYGEEFDSPKEDQIGIRDDDLPEFIKFLCSLYRIFRFPLGATGYFVNCVDAFKGKDTWPNNEQFQLKNLTIPELLNFDKHYFLWVLFDSSLLPYEKVTIPFRKVGRGGVLIEKPSLTFEIIIKKLKKRNIRFEEGLTDEEIKKVEQKFHIQFPHDLKGFLQTALPVSDRFPNWRASISNNDSYPNAINYIYSMLEWPLDGLLWDIEMNNFWWKEWELKPKRLRDAKHVCKQKFRQLPKLIPIYSHRYISQEPYEQGNPIFSVYQTDIIYYGTDLLDYLKNEFLRRDFKRLPGLRRIRFWSDLVDWNMAKRKLQPYSYR